MARVGTSDDGLIDPSEFPCRAFDMDIEAIRDSASKLRAYATAFTTNVDDIASSWLGLTPHYVAPESWQVLNLKDPVQNDANVVANVYEGIADKIETYADELEFIKPPLTRLEERALKFHNEVKGGVNTSLLDGADDWGKLAAMDSPLAPWRSASSPWLVAVTLRPCRRM